MSPYVKYISLYTLVSWADGTQEKTFCAHERQLSSTSVTLEHEPDERATLPWLLSCNRDQIGVGENFLLHLGREVWNRDPRLWKYNPPQNTRHPSQPRRSRAGCHTGRPGTESPRN